MTDQLTFRGAVYPWECDHIGHLNVMHYVGKFDQATWHFLNGLGISPSYMREQQRGMVGVQQNISYKREMLAGDIVEVRSRLLEVRDKAVRFLHTMTNAETGEVAAVCELTGVHIDRQLRRACPLPAAIRASAEAALAG